MTEHMLRMTRNASRELSNDGVKQIIMGYRGKRLAAVDPGWTPKPGMLYTQVRAISARINQNFDAWPSEELKKSYRTFIGKPVFVNHANEDPEKARGKVIAARYIESGDDKYVEVIQEVDGTRFPKLAREIREGGLDSVSMGVEAGITKCSYCGNTATDEPEFCDHVRHHKGEYLTRKNQRTGANEDVLVYENCLITGTLVTMGDGTTRPIEDIQAGDSVLDHLGTPRTVLQTMSRPVDEDTFRIYRQNNQTQAPQMTGNHPVLAIRGSAFGKDTVTRQRRLERGLRPEFIEARELQVGDWVCETHPATNGSLVKILTADYTRQNRQYETCFSPVHILPDSLELTEELGRFIGLFLAEGSVNNALTQTDFAFHQDETALADFVDQVSRSVLGLTSITHAERNGGRTVTVFSSPLAQMFSHFGVGAVNKSLPDEFMSAPIEFLRGVVAGHEEGDGLHGQTFVQRHGHKHFTCSPRLAEQIYTIHIMLGNTPYHSTRQVRPDYKHPGKSPATWLPMHIVGFGNEGQKKVGRLSFGPWTFVRIKDIEVLPYSGSVHNLEVADTHTYVAEGVAVHNCYKLGFFELSYVFDPADETAVVSRVISAARNPRRRTAYGEIEAPEDIDTLRDEDGETFEDYQFVEPISNGKGEQGKHDEDKDHNPFQHWLESPEELQAPDLGATKRLDREQESDGLDSDRRVEDVEGVLPKDEAAMAQQQGRQAMASNRNRRRYAGDDAALIDQAVQELEQYEAEMGGGDDMGDEDPYAEEGDYDEDGYSDEEDADADGDGYPEDGPEDEDGYDDDADGYDEEMEPGADEQYMGEPDGDEMDPRYGDEMMGDPRMARRYAATVGRAASTGNSRGKGKAMGSLSGRGRVAARGRNRHFADTNGYTDGGPYGNDSDQGVQEEVYISQVPPSEEVAFPVRGEDTISNTEQNLVARRNRIKAKAADLQRELRSYRRTAGDADMDMADPMEGSDKYGNPMGDVLSDTMANHGLQQLGRRYAAACRQAGVRPTRNGFRRFHAAECCDDNIIEPEMVNPAFSGTDEEGYKGDFESVQPDAVPTQPKDASLHVFRSFDNWLRNTTGRTAAQHGNANFIRRQAASYAKAAGVPLDRMFPTLDVVLRRARKTEMDRRAAMKRRADESLEVAAPQDRIDVEAPVSDITDERAQASQYDLGEYADNAGDSIADPNLDTNSQIWAPGEGDSGTKSANRKADGVAAVRYAEAVINAGLPFRDKWQLVAQAQTMRHATVVDRTRVLEAVVESNTKRSRSRKVAAAVSRGTTGNGLPRGLTAPRTAASQRTAANDPANDIGIWL